LCSQPIHNNNYENYNFFNRYTCISYHNRWNDCYDPGCQRYRTEYTKSSKERHLQWQFSHNGWRQFNRLQSFTVGIAKLPCWHQSWSVFKPATLCFTPFSLKTSTITGTTSTRRDIDLSSAMNLESLSSVLADPERVQTLQEHLPTIEGGEENMTQQLRDTLTSPQFQQALSTFSSALQSGQLGPVVSQFKLSSEAVAAANSGDLEQFVKALEKSVAAAAGGTATTTKTAKPADEEKAEAKEDTKGDDDEMKMD
jgi:hypothetical protein